LLSRDVRRNLFNLFASWSGPYAKHFGISTTVVNNANSDEEKLQFSAVQVEWRFLCFITTRLK
jgi:hypothetical protein